MAPESFETFFLATAGAGGAFVGLLFVAISIGPQRTFDPRAVAGMQHQRLAEATLLTLFNGFVAVVRRVGSRYRRRVGRARRWALPACSSPPNSSGSWPGPIGTRSRGASPGCTASVWSV